MENKFEPIVNINTIILKGNRNKMKDFAVFVQAKPAPLAFPVSNIESITLEDSYKRIVKVGVDLEGIASASSSETLNEAFSYSSSLVAYYRVVAKLLKTKDLIVLATKEIPIHEEEGILLSVDFLKSLGLKKSKQDKVQDYCQRIAQNVKKAEKNQSIGLVTEESTSNETETVLPVVKDDEKYVINEVLENKIKSTVKKLSNLVNREVEVSIDGEDDTEEMTDKEVNIKDSAYDIEARSLFSEVTKGL